MMQIKNPIRVAAIVVTATVALVLAYYQESAYAITAKRLDHHRLDEFPFSKTFRTRFPLFNATIWSYHYLQVAVYDPLQAAQDLQAKTQAMRSILVTYRSYLERPPVQWAFMPLTAELSPVFAARYAMDGRFELFKSTSRYNGRVGREQHGLL